VLVRGEECIFVGKELTVEVCVRWGDILFMSVWCVSPMWEDKYCGRWSVWFQSMSDGSGMFRSSSHVSVVVFRVCDVGRLPNEGRITTAKGEYHIFRVEGVVGL
jgi:hypothetical protein